MATSTRGVPAAVDPVVEARLRADLIVWLTTVRPDGRPHVVPTWFAWDGEAFLVFSKPHAVKVRNVRSHSQVMLAIGDPTADFDVQLVEGEAELLDSPTQAVMPAWHLRRYGKWLAEIGLSAGEYAATYSQVIRIVPTRFLPWHGRTPRRQSLVLAAAA